MPSSKHIGHRYVAQKLHSLLLCGAPYGMHLTTFQKRAILVLFTRALVQSKWTFHRFDHLEKCDLGGLSRKAISAARALLGPDHPSISEQRKDLRQKSLWYFPGSSNLAHSAITVR